MSALHVHKCKNCGATWEHPDTCVDDDKAHTCPLCEQSNNWVKYHPEAGEEIEFPWNERPTKGGES